MNKTPDTPLTGDQILQSALLFLLLEEHPEQLTGDELHKAMEGDELPAVKQALDELIAVGLVERDNGKLQPTDAARAFASLIV